MALRMLGRLRMQATKASFFSLPAARADVGRRPLWRGCSASSSGQQCSGSGGTGGGHRLYVEGHAILASRVRTARPRRGRRSPDGQAARVSAARRGAAHPRGRSWPGGLPLDLAKSRAWRALTTATGRPARPRSRRYPAPLRFAATNKAMVKSWQEVVIVSDELPEEYPARLHEDQCRLHGHECRRQYALALGIIREAAGRELPSERRRVNAHFGDVDAHDYHGSFGHDLRIPFLYMRARLRSGPRNWNAPTLRTTRNESPLGHDGSGTPESCAVARDCAPDASRLPGLSLLVGWPRPRRLGTHPGGRRGMIRRSRSPRRPRLHVEGIDSGFLEPGADGFCDGLGSVIGANVGRDAPRLHESDELIDHVLRGDAAFTPERWALPGVLIDQGEPLQGAAAFVPVEDEVKRRMWFLCSGRWRWQAFSLEPRRRLCCWRGTR